MFRHRFSFKNQSLNKIALLTLMILVVGDLGSTLKKAREDAHSISNLRQKIRSGEVCAESGKRVGCVISELQKTAYFNPGSLTEILGVLDSVLAVELKEHPENKESMLKDYLLEVSRYQVSWLENHCSGFTLSITAATEREAAESSASRFLSAFKNILNRDSLDRSVSSENQTPEDRLRLIYAYDRLSRTVGAKAYFFSNAIN